MNQSTRREFLAKASAVTAGLAVGSSGRAALSAGEQKEEQVTAQSELPIVDTHQHLWDLTKFKPPWLKDDGVEPIARSFVTKDYLEATKGLNVVKAVYMEVDVHPNDQVKEAKHIIRLCERDDNPTVAAVISGRPGSKGFKDYITQFAGNKRIKGVREVLHTSRPQGFCLQPQFVANMKVLGDLNLSYDLCMRSDEVIDTVKLVDQCPKTRFILDHCGNMDVQSTDKKAIGIWKKGIHELAQRDNVICKISGIVVTAKEKTWKPADLAAVINNCLDEFGPDRVVFGGDWPVCTLKSTYRNWVLALREIVKGRPIAEQRKLFHDNAVRHYGLS